MEAGKKRRLKRILWDDGKTVIVPMDHGLTLGPVKGLENMQKTINKLVQGGIDAVLLHKGVAKHVNIGTAGLIIHLSGITKLAPDPNLKIQVCSVEEAVRLGADAVSVHVNIGCQNEDRMLAKMGRIADECDRIGIPLLAMVYPRGPKIRNQHAVDLVSHAARLGAELGADLIKTNYTGDIETFREVVEGCFVPVVIAGGPKVDTVQDVMKMAHDSIEAGGAGISIGRNVFQYQNPDKIARALSAIIHDGATIEESLRILGVLN